MTRNKLSLKKANMISNARKSATSNPFIIYDIFDVIEKIITKNKLEAKHIRNCHESGFPHDPSKCLSVTVKGQVAYRVTSGSGRENTKTLAVSIAFRTGFGSPDNIHRGKLSKHLEGTERLAKYVPFSVGKWVDDHGNIYKLVHIVLRTGH